jgi:hypothetical protein
MCGTISLKEALHSKASLRAFLVVLINRLVITVAPDKSRRVDISLSLQDQVVVNSQQKFALQEKYRKNVEQREFVAELDQPGVHVYEGKTPWRWGSAGYAVRLIIEGEAYWALLLRCGVKPPGWNLAVGATVSLAELQRPQEAAERRGKIELIVVDVSTGRYQPLEIPGGRYIPTKLHYETMRRMCVSAHMNDEPLIGVLASDLRDVVYVRVDWEEDRWPFISGRALVIPNHEDGEIGLEFVQVAEWTLHTPLHSIRLFNGEVFEAGAETHGHASGEPIGQPVGLFRERDLIREIQKPNPVLKPTVVYENGFAHTGAELERWLNAHPDSQRSCPVTLKALCRYLLEVRGLGNSFVFVKDNHMKNGRWHVTFEGRSCALPDFCGLRIIAHSILNAGHISSYDDIDVFLNPRPLPEPDYETMTEGELQSIGLTKSGSAREHKATSRDILRRMERSKESLEKEVQGLRDAAEDAAEFKRFAELSKIEAWIDKTKKELALVTQQIREVEEAKQQGILALGATSNPEFQKRKNRIDRCIQRAMSLIKEHDRDLFVHLKRFLTHDRGCLYQPPEHVRWTVQGL